MINDLHYKDVYYKMIISGRYTVQTPILGYHIIDPDGVELEEDGLLSIIEPFGCDWASGPTFDSKHTRRPSVEHDALYKQIGRGKLPMALRKQIDDFFLKRLYEEIELEAKNMKLARPEFSGKFSWLQRGWWHTLNKGNELKISLFITTQKKRAKVWYHAVRKAGAHPARDNSESIIHIIKGGQ